MKILHLPTAAGGNSWGLRCGERAIGLDSHCLSIDSGWLGYETDFMIDINQNSGRLARAYKLFKTFIDFRKGYDVYHFNYGQTLLNYPRFGLPLLDLAFYDGKSKIFATYNGCDARQKYPTVERTDFSACHLEDCYEGACESGQLDRYRKMMIDKMSKYASQMFAVNPDLLHFLPEGSRFIPYTIPGWDNIHPSPPTFDSKALKVLHAPTNRAAKGTKYLEDAVKKINERKPGAVELIMVERVPYDKALKIYQSADIVVDQLLIGWYGALAVEVMKMGKPVVCFIRDEDLKFIPGDMKTDLYEAIINANHDSIYTRLLECVENRTTLSLKSQASMEYANKWHNPSNIATTVKGYYEA